MDDDLSYQKVAMIGTTQSITKMIFAGMKSPSSVVSVQTLKGYCINETIAAVVKTNPIIRPIVATPNVTAINVLSVA